MSIQFCPDPISLVFVFLRTVGTNISVLKCLNNAHRLIQTLDPHRGAVWVKIPFFDRGGCLMGNWNINLSRIWTLPDTAGAVWRGFGVASTADEGSFAQEEKLKPLACCKKVVAVVSRKFFKLLLQPFSIARWSQSFCGLQDVVDGCRGYGQSINKYEGLQRVVRAKTVSTRKENTRHLFCLTRHESAGGEETNFLRHRPDLPSKAELWIQHRALC